MPKWIEDADTRAIFWIYAALAWAGGLLLPGWGAYLLPAGCMGAAFAMVDDPASRRRGLYWFSIAHVVAGWVLLVQLGFGKGEAAAQAFLGLGMVFLALWAYTPGSGFPKDWPLLSIFGSAASTETVPLRSRYEQQIREAAGQEERNRLARDLHDSVKQQIFAIQTAAATAQARFDPDPQGARQALDEVRNAAREAMAEMQAMLDQLRAAPLENVGLLEALKHQAEALAFRTGAKVDFLPGRLPPATAFAPGVYQAILRTAQEALANIARHARATRGAVTLAPVGKTLVLRVEDNGAGFDPNHACTGMGMSNMRARAEESGGTFEVISRPGEGTVVTFAVPFSMKSVDEYRQSAIMWGLSAAGQIAFAVWARTPAWTFVAAVMVVICARETRSWLRARKQPGAAA